MAKKHGLAKRILDGADAFASLFSGGELAVLGAFAALLGGSAMRKSRYRRLTRRRVKQQFDQTVTRICTALAEEAQSMARDTLVHAYEATAEEISAFAEEVAADSERMQREMTEIVDDLARQINNSVEIELRHMRRDTDDVYRQVIEQVRGDWLSPGNASKLNAEVQSALNEFAGRGVTGFTDRAGRRWGLYEYANMAMRTAIHRAGLQATIDTMRASGYDLAYITRHPGACPLCERWYGTILSISGNDPTHPSLQGAMDQGLFHPNCADVLQVYFPGVSDLTAGMGEYTPEQSAERYASSQRQRALEREIRKWKRMQAAAITPEQERVAKAYIDRLQRQLRALTGETKLPRRYDREGGRVRLSEAARKIKPFTIDENGRVIADGAAKREDGISFGARTAIYNTGRQVYFNPEASYSVMLDGYSDEVNVSISKAARDVALKGSESRTEHMYLVNLKTGELEFYETNNEPSSVGYMFYKHLAEHPNDKFALVHNHNTDSAFSETDMRTLLTIEGTPLMLAVRDDGIIYVAERNGGVQTNGDFDSMYENDLDELNQKLRSGIITMSKRTKERERIIVENLLRDYTKGGKLIEFN